MIRLYNLAVGKSGKPAMRPLPLEYASIEAMLSSFQAVSLDAQQAMGGDMQALPENVFYSVAHVEVGKERTFISQDILALDIDKVTEAEAERVLQVAASCLGVPSLEACAGVFSGHGVHLLLPLKKIATDVSWFSKYREHFKYLCQEVNKALKTAGLNGEADPTSFGRGKVFRLPGTVNKKPGKDPVECVLLRPVTARWGEFRFDFDEFAETTKFSGPDNSKHDYISDHVLKQFPKPDNQAILGEKGCLFLKYCKDEPASVSEPQWYAMLSVTSRMDETGELSHKLSSGHKSYSREETEAKNKQALLASGPRTCSSISEVFPDCHKCLNFEKVKSPILIRSKGHVATEHTGFHFIVPGASPGKEKAIPDIHGFVDYVAREFGPVIKPRGLGEYMFWQGKHFYSRDEGFLTKLAHDKFDPQVRPHTVQDCLRLFEQKFPASLDLSQQEKKINLNNGVLDLSTNPPRLLEHAPEFQFGYVSEFDFDPRAEAPLFEKFLLDVLSGDQDKIRLVKEFFAYAMFSTSNYLQKALFLLGDGANGKSVLLEVMRHVFGADNTTAISIDDLVKDTHKVRLIGKSLNLSGETGMKSLLRSEEFKKIVSGDPITGRDLYQQTVEFVPRVKIVVACNELPQFSDRSSGTIRRMLVLRFHKNYEKLGTADPFLAEKLKAEAPGILNILIKAYQDLTARGRFIEPEESKEILGQHRIENDSVLGFIKLYIETAPENFITNNNIYENYRRYCLESEFKPLNKIKFFRIFAQHLGQDSIVKKFGGKTVRGYNIVYTDEFMNKEAGAFY